MTDLDDQDFEAIGRMVVACARLEGVVRPVLAALMGLQEDMARIAMADRPYSWILEGLKAAVQSRVADDALNGEWRAWITDAQRANVARNGVVHALWIGMGAYRGDVMASVRSPRRRGHAHTLEFTDRKGLAKLGTTADHHTQRLVDLIKKTPGILAQ